jgi:hypothetical protein
LEHAPPDVSVRDSIKNQVRIVETEFLDKIAPLRDPGLE